MFGAETASTAEAKSDRTEIDVSIVIVAWNAKRFIRDCLTSINASRETLSMEIVVVDNASSDGTGEVVERDFPHVKLVKSEKNLGFARGNNAGLALCRGKYLCLVNPDVIVQPDCIRLLCAHMEHDLDVGLAGPQLLDWDGKPGRSTMRFPTLWNLFCRAVALDRVFSKSRAFGGFLMSDFRPDAPVDVDILNGWFWIVRREALQEVGVLDRRLFMYGDDIDWSHRFHQGGWRVVLYPDAQAKHYGGGTTERAPVRFLVERERANFQYWTKFHGRTSTLTYRAICSVNHMIRITGYILLHMVRPKRQDILVKRDKSLASLRWLLTLKFGESEVMDETVKR